MEPQDYTLLVVDDNEMNRDMLSRRLQRKGYRVLVAEDGRQALEVVAEEAVDLVLLDIMMPGIDGVEVLETLRRGYSQTELPVIMATAKADSQDMVRALDLGANDYVVKPLDFPVVLARVQTHLRTKTAAPQPRRGEPTLAEIEPGAVVAGKYCIERKIGVGNFGAVYRARHLDLDSDVALKVLLPTVTASEESMKRFRQEGVAACRVQHPNAVRVSDFGVSDTRVAYLVMELLEGRSLLAELRTAEGGRRPLTPERCLEILGPVCDVLAEAHAAGIVHRDVKPENVFLHRGTTGEVVKVLDFGIAKLVGETVTQENLTAEGWIVGTPTYMAPERLQNRPYDGRADVYSLGILLFEMLTGERPFQPASNDPMAVIMTHLKDEPATLRSVDPGLSPELGELVERALRKEPGERPDARQLKAGLERALGAVPCPPESSPAESRPVEFSPMEPTPVVPVADPPALRPPEIDHEAPTVAVPAAGSDEGFLRRWLRKLTRGR